ncbi:hypothetical protein [uncultured Roseibium sp.]|uniref:hypothetical protein n=1 Tax=uncultured Roseibium sp. TaxID=1936171 RepID=UPI0032163B12
MEDIGHTVRELSHALPLCVELEIFGPRQGHVDFLRMPLDAEVSLAVSTITDPTDDTFGFQIGFKRIFLDVSTKGCRIAKDGRYKRSVPKEEFKLLLKRNLEEKSVIQRERRGEIGANIQGILKFLKISASMKGGREKSKTDASSDVQETEFSLYLVQRIAGMRWEIGHETLGDPLQVDGLLRGSYLSPPSDGNTKGDYTPLCYLEAEVAKRYSATIEIRAATKDCVYLPVVDGEDAHKLLEEKTTQIERILAIKALQKQNRKDGFDPPDDEIILARGEISFYRKTISGNENDGK